MKAYLLTIISNVKNKIPTQGPLAFFIHHNTLHHYEHLNFHCAVKEAAFDYSCNAYMPESYYLNKYKMRIIKRKNVEEEIKIFILQYELTISPDLLYRLLIKGPLLNRLEHDPRSFHTQKKLSKDRFLFNSTEAKSAENIDLQFYQAPILLNFFQAYFDFGNAPWTMPFREKGMMDCFKYLHIKKTSSFNLYEKLLSRQLAELESLSSIDAVGMLLKKMSVDKEHYDTYLFELTIKYKGWAGLLISLQDNPQWNLCPDIQPNFMDFLLILLVCDYTARERCSNSKEVKPKLIQVPCHSLAFLDYFYSVLDRNPEVEKDLLTLLPFFTDIDRQKILHKAYEASFYDFFSAAYFQANKNKPIKKSEYDYQIVTCIDDREESFRRYLEIDEKCETFGFAGHFGLNIEFKGAYDKHYRALCPLGPNKKNWVNETLLDPNKCIATFIYLIGKLTHFSSIATKTLLRGYIHTFFSFALNTIPTFLEIINPSLTKNLKTVLLNLKERQKTILNYKVEEGIEKGFTLSNRVEAASNFLRAINLTTHFAQYVFIFGHGSISLNNPHEAAHDCGACGGGRGKANARLMAMILNESAVRKALKEQNIIIPPSVLFIGAYHNTAHDNLYFYDVESVNDPQLIDVCHKLEVAASWDAKERCRRFNDEPFGKTKEYYRKSVSTRAFDFRQPRPEYGHATNAICIIGPREKTRNLFLDRRAFLVSYSSKEDKNLSILKTVLTTAVPVCAGINLEYYFSFIDNEFYGCGTKLPHNITSLVGVMNGSLSDLKPGLPWQMVEIHQPIRLLVLIHCALDNMKMLLEIDSVCSKLVKNEWINLIIDDDKTGDLWQYSSGVFIKHGFTKDCPQYILPDNLIMDTKQHIEFGSIIK